MSDVEFMSESQERLAAVVEITFPWGAALPSLFVICRADDERHGAARPRSAADTL